MKWYYFFVMSLLLASTDHLFGYVPIMKFVNPQNSYNYSRINISRIEGKVVPQGIFTSYEIEYEINCTQPNLNKTQLELQWLFELPDGAFMNNAWLWVGDTLVEADIMDKWTASMIYEEIVSRRRDPLLIMKNNNVYDLKLYPFIGNEPRKFIIKFMMPNSINGTNVISSFDTKNILPSNTNIVVAKTKMSVLSDELVKIPLAIQNSDFTSQTAYGGENNESLYYEFTQSTNNTILNYGFSYQIKNQNNILFAYSKTSNNSGYYQLSVPKNIINIDNPEEVLYLVNFNSSKVSIPESQVINYLKNHILLNLSNNDKFNVMMGDYKIKKLSESWLDNSDNLDSLFSQKDFILSKYSVLPNLIFEGIKFVKEKGDNCKIVLINCSDEFYSPESANSFIEDVFFELPPQVSINIIDYQTSNYMNYYKNGAYYYGNDYFNSIISKKTGGNYFNYRTTGGNIGNFINNALLSMNFGFDNLELRVKPKNGLTYLTYDLNSSQQPGTNVADIQYGRFVGEFPISVEVVGIKNTQFYTHNFEVHERDAINFKETSKIWMAKYLKDLESITLQNDNKRIREIIDISISERILTNYTAFLALEPWMTKKDTINTDEDPDDDTNPTDITDENTGTGISIAAYPNPFVDFITIRLDNLAVNEELVTVEVYDLNGNIIKEFDLNSLSSNISYDLSWNSTDLNLANGMYFLVVKTTHKTYKYKLVKSMKNATD